MTNTRMTTSPASERPSGVVVDAGAAVATVTIDRPQVLNALDDVTLRELLAAFEGLAGSPLLRCVILTGAGDKAFVAGADIARMSGLGPREARAFAELGHELGDAIEALSVPVIAAVNGFALGGGCELALACDIRIAAETAEMGLTEVRLGIIPGAGGTQRLARVAGVAAAKELTLTGRRIGAARARELGLVSEVVPPAELPAAAARWAAEISGAAPLALTAAKRAIDEGVALPLHEGLAVERARYEEVLVTDDRNEGLAAFAQKRPPVYKGR
jgi:enoyl-CoA hydratase